MLCIYNQVNFECSNEVVDEIMGAMTGYAQALGEMMKVR